MEPVNIYMTFSLIITTFGFLATIYAWFKPRILKSRLCWAIIFTTSLWSLSYTSEMLSTGYAAKVFWCSFKLASGFMLPIILLLYVIQFMEIKTLNLRTQILLSIPSLVASTIIFTRMYLHVPWVEIVMDAGNPNSTLNVTLGFGYLLLLAYNYFLIGAILFQFVRVIAFSPKMYTRRILVLTVLLVVPWVSHYMFISGVSPYNLDLSPILSNMAAILVIWISPEKLYKEDVLPVARESVIDNMLDSVILVDAAGKIIYMNPAAVELAEIDKSKSEGEYLTYAWPSLMEQMDLKSGLVGQELEIMSGDTKRIFEATVTTMRNVSMEVSNRIVVLRDISEYRRYSEKLEKLVEERTRQLRNAERFATIGETATMVGHDLRNPLQVIVGYTQLLKGMFTNEGVLSNNPPDSEKVMNIVEILSNQTYYMNKIVSDLQDYARPIKPTWSAVNMEDVVTETLSTMNLDNIQVVTDFSGCHNLSADSDLIRRLLTNLASNAIQAMPDGGKLTIMCLKIGSNTVISVEDTGVGIPPENMPKLFRPLFTTKPKGTGFGLAVCKRLVDVHNGRIDVESKVGVGTVFRVIIPILDESVISEQSSDQLIKAE